MAGFILRGTSSSQLFKNVTKEPVFLCNFEEDNPLHILNKKIDKTYNKDSLQMRNTHLFH